MYLNAIGGAAQFYARCIERTDGVSLTGVRHSRSHVASLGPRLSRPSSPWTRTATACTRISKPSRAKKLEPLSTAARVGVLALSSAT